MKKYIIKDFSFSNDSKDIVKLNFLKEVSKTSVCVSKKTGLVYYNKFKKSSEVLNEWSKKIYNGRMNQNSNNYTDDVPAMSARHFYVLDFF